MPVHGKQYHAGDVYKSFNWLGHKGHGWTELIAFHKGYKPGRENWQENLRKGYLPKIWYTQKPQAAVRFAQKYFREHMCCYGVNPRPEPLKNGNGYNRSAKDEDIRTVLNFYFDIDCLSKEPTKAQLADLGMFMLRAEGYFQDLGLNAPVLAFSGRGYHLLFSLVPISVEEHPDIKDRLNFFRNEFQAAFNRELENLEARLDNTLDLKRVAKIYGTRKPGGRYLSQFKGDRRIEDKALAEYLLSLEPVESPANGINLAVDQKLPETFRQFLQEDTTLQKLWNGTGKSRGDTSRSGYDFSIMRYCLNRGITDIGDLATILTLRPKGCVWSGNKGEQYIKATIANAIKG